MAFQLDTSGAVDMKPPGPLRPGCIQTVWDDLDPFTQGYVEAMPWEALSLEDWRARDPSPPSAPYQPLGFRHLAPETLARIMEDCELLLVSLGRYVLPGNSDAGRKAWMEQQAGRLRSFPPLTPYLGDDGTVYLWEAA